jgi:hypothetical protein
MANSLIDPLAQTFYVDNPKGIFATSIDIFFYEGDSSSPVTLQLRPTVNGLPSATDIYPFSSVTLDPPEIVISPDAADPTRFTFPSPVFLKGETFHAIVLTCNSKDYSVWVAKMGDTDVTKLNDATSKRVFVSANPNSGNFFRSQNGSVWTPSETEDLKFTLSRANFKENSGNINFYNPELDLGNQQIAILDGDAFEFESRQERLLLSTGINDVGFTTGVTVSQQGSSNAAGNYIGNAGAASSLTIFNAGIGYTPSAGGLTYFDVPLTKVTGLGKNATCNLTIQNGVAVGATIVDGGTGFAVGDLVTANTVGTGLGRNLRLTVSELGNINEIIVDDIQGLFLTGAGTTIQYENSSGIVTALNGGGVLTTDSTIIHDGLHIKVNHPNHGMYAEENVVTIADVDADHPSVDLAADVLEDSTAPIQLENMLINETTGLSVFATFENVGVSSTNPGYIEVEEEIIGYTGISSNTLTGIIREVDGTKGAQYEKGVDVVKYECNGISLRRLNKTHELQDATVDNPIDLDYYHIKIDMQESGVDRSNNVDGYPDLFIRETKSSGGDDINATQNIQYEIIDPEIKVAELTGTDIEINLRSTTGRSIGGNQESFLATEFETISTTEETYLSSPRIICSRINETELLDGVEGIEGNKSLNLSVNLTTTTPTLSPVIDLDRCSVILIGNRMNKPIDDYITDERTSDLENDPHAFVYATRPIALETPATSIQVFLTAYVNTKSDIRAFYSISDEAKEEMIYYPFPGYANLNERGEVIDISKSDGTTDKKVKLTDSIGFKPEDLTYKEFKFSINKLPSFKAFGIKLVATTEDTTYPVRMRDLRVIALA